MSPWPAPESDIWRPRRGILPGWELRRELRTRPAWRLAGQQLVREWHFKDFTEAFGFVERLADEVEDFGRRPDICLIGGNRVRVSVANPNHAGVTVAELRMIGKVDAAAERHLADRVSAAPAPARAGIAADSHEHPLGA